MSNVYSIITERIIAKLETGVVPWQVPWSQGDPYSKNLVSRAPYRGVNAVLTSVERFCKGYSSPFWLTYRQALTLGGTVRRGEKGTPIVYWTTLEKESDEGETDDVPLLRYFTIFNTDQCDGLSADIPEPTTFDTVSIDRAEQTVAAMADKPRICPGAEIACYLPALDTIRMPDLNRFARAEEYYSTLFHELGHATGHESRLNRKTLVDRCPFGTSNYSKEELTAEMTAAFLCAHCGITDQTVDSSAAYIGGWLAKLKANPRLVVEAASGAQRAADYLLGIAPPNRAERTPAAYEAASQPSL